LLAAATPAAAQAPAPPERAVELRFALTAELSSATLDARIEAGARLLMERSADGRRLSLVRPLEPAWKLYRVDPLGPGDEAKMAAEVTLPEAGWPALEAARAEVERRAAARWAEWKKAGLDRGQALDGTFAFVVIGPPAGRFEIDLGTDGLPQRITNRLTDRWLSGPLEALFESWERRAGYWFWNAGAKPFEWEPHVYHALAVAVELLGEPRLVPGAEDLRTATARQWRHPVAELGARVGRVLSTLAPKTRGRLRAPRATAVELVRARPEAGGRWRVESELEDDTGSEAASRPLALRRRWVVDGARGTVIAQRVTASVVTSSGSVTVEVEIRPAEAASPSL
jgi:hypothetical protein